MTRTRLALLLSVPIAALGLFAWWRVGALDLPPAPPGVTLESAGLARLPQQKALHDYLWSMKADPAPPADLREPPEAVKSVRAGLVAALSGDAEAGLAQMRSGLGAAPDSLVLANAYRMICFRLKREFLQQAQRESVINPQFPPSLADEPIHFLKELAEKAPSRESKFSLALAWVDHMLLFPALEIKAPSSVEAVNILSGLLDQDPAYVPALYARGLNHLHRPSRLVWPEAEKTPIDAAARDIGLCVAIGRKLHAGSSHLQAQLALALGDAYVKAGRLGVARSWWQVAQNLSSDDALKQGVRRRFGWRDAEMLDRLEEELDRARSQLQRPMTDLAFMWE